MFLPDKGGEDTQGASMTSESGGNTLSPKLAALLKSHLFGDENATRYFQAVVRRGGFSLAARSLGLKLAALRSEISQLEERLNMRLFYVNSGRATLTDEGEQLYQLCEQLQEGAATTDLYGEQSELVLSIPPIVLEGFLYRELLNVIRENSALKVTLANDEPDVQRSADVVVWLHEPRTYNELRGKLDQPRLLSTLTFSPYITERVSRGRTPPETLDDLKHYMTVQYQGYERFASFAPWNDCIAQRRHSAIHVESPQAQWQMIRWANCIGLLPDKSAFLNSGARRLPNLVDQPMELDVWVGINTHCANLSDANMIARRIAHALSRQ